MRQLAIASLAPRGGEVATSTTNRPLSSSSFFMTGVVAFQSWLFLSSMTTTRILLVFSPAVPMADSAASKAAAQRGPAHINRLNIAGHLSSWRFARLERGDAAHT